MRAWLCPVCMCICVTAMRLMLQIVCSLLSRKWKLYCSEHARFKSLLPPYVLITKKHKLKDVSPAKTPRRSRREFQINAAWPEKDIWTNANADKMAAVAKLTGGRKKMELNAVWKSCMLISQQPKRKNTHRQSQNFSHLVRVARAAKSSRFAYFLNSPSAFCFGCAAFAVLRCSQRCPDITPSDWLFLKRKVCDLVLLASACVELVQLPHNI